MRQGAVVHLPVGTLRAGEVAGVSGVAVRGRAACRGVEKQRAAGCDNDVRAQNSTSAQALCVGSVAVGGGWPGGWDAR